jgi:hypothetical protein
MKHWAEIHVMPTGDLRIALQGLRGRKIRLIMGNSTHDLPLDAAHALGSMLVQYSERMGVADIIGAQNALKQDDDFFLMP